MEWICGMLRRARRAVARPGSGPIPADLSLGHNKFVKFSSCVLPAALFLVLALVAQQGTLNNGVVAPGIALSFVLMGGAVACLAGTTLLLRRLRMGG